MLRIYVRKPGEHTGKVYRSEISIMNDRVLRLPWTFVEAGVIAENEWARSLETIATRFGLYIKETKCDGRTKRVRGYRRFTWSEILLK